MADRPKEYSHLAEEIVELVLSKVHRLPTKDPSLVVIAAVEAIAWIAASESSNHCKANGGDAEAAMKRIAEYTNLFTNRAQRDLTEAFKDRENGS